MFGSKSFDDIDRVQGILFQLFDPIGVCQVLLWWMQEVDLSHPIYQTLPCEPPHCLQYMTRLRITPMSLCGHDFLPYLTSLSISFIAKLATLQPVWDSSRTNNMFKKIFSILFIMITNLRHYHMLLT